MDAVVRYSFKYPDIGNEVSKIIIHHLKSNGENICNCLMYIHQVINNNDKSRPTFMKDLISTFPLILSFSQNDSQQIRSILWNKVIPSFLMFENDGGISVNISWSKLVWEEITSISNHPDLACELPCWISAIFDSFQGLRLEPTTPSSTKKQGLDDLDEHLVFKPEFLLLDLRFEPLVFEITLKYFGLEDATALKYSMYLLKRIVDFSKKHTSSAESSFWTK